MTSTHPEEGTASPAPTIRPAVAVDPFPTWAVIAYGALSVVLGVMLLVWPKATLIVAVALLAVQLIITGVVQLVRCVSPWAAGAGERTLLAISGALALLAALLILRRPLQTLVLVTLLVGAWWIVRGVMDVVGAIPGGRPHRGWSLFLGAISLIAGIYVLLNPGISLVVFVWVSGIWMIATGITVAVAAILLRRST